LLNANNDTSELVIPFNIKGQDKKFASNCRSYSILKKIQIIEGKFSKLNFINRVAVVLL